MVGNKHKNGIICTFPNCHRPMRTQKFKMHFIRAHLRDGEVYSVEHRRQYEVAREENARSSVKHELVSVAAAPAMPPVISMATTGGESICVETPNLESARLLHENGQTSQTKQLTSVQSQRVQLTSQAEASTSKKEEFSASAFYVSSMDENVSLSAEHTRGRKRLASAVETSAETVDPTNILLMQFIKLMDQRFQELVGKMGEMIDIQKDLIDALHACSPHCQASSSAFLHAVDVVMKRRKKDTSPQSDNNDSEDINGSSNTDTEASSGFVL